jgi:hypothetical protein
MVLLPSPRTKVFISYSHADEEWLKQLKRHLKPLERKGRLACWDDTHLRPGDDWKQEIQNALNTAQVAVLLISADFFASDFIDEDELPPLLAAAQAKGVRVLPVILNASRFARNPNLARFQAVNSPDRPLAKMAPAEREEVFDRLAQIIETAFKSSEALYWTEQTEAKPFEKPIETLTPSSSKRRKQPGTRAEASPQAEPTDGARRFPVGGNQQPAETVPTADHPGASRDSGSVHTSIVTEHHASTDEPIFSAKRRHFIAVTAAGISLLSGIAVVLITTNNLSIEVSDLKPVDNIGGISPGIYTISSPTSLLTSPAKGSLATKQLPVGMSVEVTGRIEAWYQVKTPSGYGYISASNLKVSPKS